MQQTRSRKTGKPGGFAGPFLSEVEVRHRLPLLAGVAPFLAVTYGRPPPGANLDATPSQERADAERGDPVHSREGGGTLPRDVARHDLIALLWSQPLAGEGTLVRCEGGHGVTVPRVDG